LAEAKAAGDDLEVIVLDTTSEDDRQAAFAYEIDVLVNNAGIMETGPIAEIPSGPRSQELRDQRIWHLGDDSRLRRHRWSSVVTARS
jgi:NAD(P)-dependent dehydrogenase (short-subunit alcohol dehydrogenase family)